MNNNIKIASIILDLNVKTKYKSYLEIFGNNNGIFLYLLPHFNKLYAYSDNLKVIDWLRSKQLKCDKLKKIKFNYSKYNLINPYHYKVIFCNPEETTDDNYWNTLRSWLSNNLLIVLSYSAPSDFIKLNNIDDKYIFIHKSEIKK